MPKDFWRWCRLWQVMNNDTKCSSWLRKRPTGQKQSRDKFACCKITSEAGRSNATFAAQILLPQHRLPEQIKAGKATLSTLTPPAAMDDGQDLLNYGEKT